MFGIQQTDLVDAPPPVPDARPPSCPELGVAPKFGTDLGQVPGRKCDAYSLDETQRWAAAISYDYQPPDYAANIVSGPAAEQPFTQTMVPAPVYPNNVRLAPEGNVLFVTAYDTDAYKIFEYELVDTRWVLKGKPFLPPDHSSGEYYILSTPTRGPLRRMVMHKYNSVLMQSELLEIEYDGTEPTEVARTPLSALEVDLIGQPSLSADGLRLVFTSASTETAPMPNMPDTTGGGGGGIAVGDQSVFYVARESISTPFATKAKLLETVPSYVGWPYLTEDCGRMYFSALNTVWYLKYEP